jgi:hypothetical protein
MKGGARRVAIAPSAGMSPRRARARARRAGPSRGHGIGRQAPARRPRRPLTLQLVRHLLGVELYEELVHRVVAVHGLLSKGVGLCGAGAGWQVRERRGRRRALGPRAAAHGGAPAECARLPSAAHRRRRRSGSAGRGVGRAPRTSGRAPHGATHAPRAARTFAAAGCAAPAARGGRGRVLEPAAAPGPSRARAGGRSARDWDCMSRRGRKGRAGDVGGGLDGLPAASASNWGRGDGQRPCREPGTDLARKAPQDRRPPGVLRFPELPSILSPHQIAPNPSAPGTQPSSGPRAAPDSPRPRGTGQASNRRAAGPRGARRRRRRAVAASRAHRARRHAPPAAGRRGAAKAERQRPASGGRRLKQGARSAAREACRQARGRAQSGAAAAAAP